MIIKRNVLCAALQCLIGISNHLNNGRDRLADAIGVANAVKKDIIAPHVPISHMYGSMIVIVNFGVNFSVNFSVDFSVIVSDKISYVQVCMYSVYYLL